jgi:hypothetical protein
MAANAREFIDFWILNSVHAAELQGAAQDVTELARRCVDMAQDQGLSKEDLESEVGDLAVYIRAKLRTANQAERDRPRG